MSRATATTDGVHDAKPPAIVAAVSSAVLKVILRTPMARRIRPLALVQFTGRRTGKKRPVVVGWHSLDGVAVVFTPASWRANFTDSAPSLAHHQYERLQLVGTLVTDPTQAADARNTVIRGGVSAKLLALHVPEGYTVTAADVCAVHRSMIRFQPATNSAT